MYLIRLYIYILNIIYLINKDWYNKLLFNFIYNKKYYSIKLKYIKYYDRYNIFFLLNNIHELNSEELDLVVDILIKYNKLNSNVNYLFDNTSHNTRLKILEYIIYTDYNSNDYIIHSIITDHPTYSKYFANSHKMYRYLDIDDIIYYCKNNDINRYDYVMECIKSNDYRNITKQLYIAKYGSDEEKGKINISKTEEIVLFNLVRYGNNEMRDRLYELTTKKYLPKLIEVLSEKNISYKYLYGYKNVTVMDCL